MSNMSKPSSTSRLKKKEGGSASGSETRTTTDQGKRRDNLFVNDGSFMEMFKRSMEEQEKSLEQKSGVSEPKNEPDSVYYSTQTIHYKKDDPGAGGLGDKAAPQKQYQGIIGKRKSLMRTVELREKRKKRQEELEEQQHAELKEQKSSAWKSYMAEVKAYEERRCGDSDDHKRPLVK